MTQETDIRIVEVECNFEPVEFRAPLKFGGRVMERTDLMNVTVTVVTRRGTQATGEGSMPVGNIWAWPSSSVAPLNTERAMKSFLESIVHLANDYDEFGHPLDLCYRFSAEYEHQGRAISQKLGIDEPLPELAQLVAASPIDAALHDAFGRVHGLNSFDTLGEEFVAHDLSEYLDDRFAGEYLDQYTLRKPKPRLPLYHLVGALDPLTETEIENRIDDGLPETLPEWILADGLTHLKIKLNGDDLDWDVQRVLAVERITAETQSQRNQSVWYYSCDFNEKCENVDYILAFLNRIRESSVEAYDRIQYVEQPTHRDLVAHPENKMHEAAKLKPIVIDESLTDYDALLLSREMGYSGIALKACKGQTESLFLAAAAQKFGMFLCVQDLSCPGYSFLHSASLAAHIPGVAAIEGNSRQYCPGPNKTWAIRYPGMFKLADGSVETGLLGGIGLGF